MKLIDSHCHLDFEEYASDLTGVLERAQAAGVSRMISIGSGKDLTSARSAVNLAERHPFIWATVGVHPHDVANMVPSDWDELVLLARHPRVRGIGETGLDYHYEHSPRQAQQSAFARFAELGRTADLALSVHVRDAHADAIAMLRQSGNARVVIHCFTGGPEEARQYLDLGFFLSFSGIVTFKNAAPVREAARLVPADRLLVETDAPYLAPVPLRGKRNEPAFIVHTAQVLAELRNVDLETLGEQTWRNTSDLFRLDVETKKA